MQPSSAVTIGGPFGGKLFAKAKGFSTTRSVPLTWAGPDRGFPGALALFVSLALFRRDAAGTFVGGAHLLSAAPIRLAADQTVHRHRRNRCPLVLVEGIYRWRENRIGAFYIYGTCRHARWVRDKSLTGVISDLDAD